MPSITYEFVPGQQVFIFETSVECGNSVKAAIIEKVNIDINNLDSAVTYNIRFTDTNLKVSNVAEGDIYAELEGSGGTGALDALKATI